MLPRPSTQELLAAIGRLRGGMSAQIWSDVQAVTDAFNATDQDAHDTFQNNTDSGIRKHLLPNQFLFTDHEPAREVVFLCCELSSDVALMRYVAHIRTIVRKHLAQNARFADIGFQHATLITEMLGPHCITPTNVERISQRYGEVLRSTAPFHIAIKGPHITKTGGLILEGACYSSELFDIRRHAASLPESNLRIIPRLIHTTIGYVTAASQREMINLWQLFRNERGRQSEHRIRVRNIQIAMSRNASSCGELVTFRLKGTRALKLSEAAVVHDLRLCRQRCTTWQSDCVLAGLVLEEALYWSEQGNGLVAETAEDLLACCAIE